MTAWRGRRVLVTGATGFIGANLVDSLLSVGADVHAVVRPSTRPRPSDALPDGLVAHTADLVDPDQTRAVVLSVRPDIVFHLAVRRGHFDSPVERESARADTLLATSNLCRAASDLELSRFVHFGSSLEYGAANVPLSETRHLAPTTGRGLVKAAESAWCLQFAQESGLPLVLIRPFSVYGPREDPSRLVPTVMRALLSGGDVRLTRPGFRRDFVFVEDVVRASLLAATAPRVIGEVINVANGRQWTNEALVDAAQRVTGIPIRVVMSAFETRPVDTDHWVADVRKARDLLGWSADYSLDDGLLETFRWFAGRADAVPAVDAMGAVR